MNKDNLLYIVMGWWMIISVLITIFAKEYSYWVLILPIGGIMIVAGLWALKQFIKLHFKVAREIKRDYEDKDDY